MKVVILYGAADLYGASRVLLADCRRLVEDGHSVEVVLPFDGPLAHRLAEAGARASVERLHVIRRADLLRSLAPPRSVPAACHDADIVVLWTLALGLYGPLLKKSGLAFGVSVHELVPGVKGALLARLSAVGAQWAHANSIAVRTWLRKVLPARVPVHMAYPDAEPPAVRPPHRNGRPLRVAIAGRTNGNKGHLLAIRATETARLNGTDIELDLYGEPFPGQERHLDAVMHEVKSAPWANYCGGYDGAPPFSAYDLVLFLPTAPESFGLIPLEAWSHGTACIGIPAGGAAESLALVDGIPVGPDARAIARAISWFGEQRDQLRVPIPTAPASILCTAARRRRLWKQTLRS